MPDLAEVRGVCAPRVPHGAASLGHSHAMHTLSSCSSNSRPVTVPLDFTHPDLLPSGIMATADRQSSYTQAAPCGQRETSG